MSAFVVFLIVAVTFSALYVAAFAFGPGIALRWRRRKAGRR